MLSNYGAGVVLMGTILPVAVPEPVLLLDAFRYACSMISLRSFVSPVLVFSGETVLARIGAPSFGTPTLPFHPHEESASHIERMPIIFLFMLPL